MLGNLSEVMEAMESLTSAPKYAVQVDQDSNRNILRREPCLWGSYARPRAILDYCCCDQNCADVLEACGLFGKAAIEQN